MHMNARYKAFYGPSIILSPRTSNSRTIKSMPHNEYIMIRSLRTLGNPERLFPLIQEKEQKGWELVSILPFTVLFTVGYTIIMRRPSTESTGRNA